MQIVTDTGMDLDLLPHLMPEIDINVVCHVIDLDGKTYRSGEDISCGELQDLLTTTDGLPKTSVPAANEFAETYRKLAASDPDILSIHMSSGLSGVVNAATATAQTVPEANVTIIDTKTLSMSLGWQVSAAARALKAGWPSEKIQALVKKIGDATDSIYTLSDLTYLIHGGRIGHMKGLLASALNIKPIIGVEKVNGTYVQLAMARTFKKALGGLVDHVLKTFPAGSALRVQVGHGSNPDAAQKLRDLMDAQFKCDFMPFVQLSPVLAAHTGPTIAGLVYAPQEVFEDLP
jgi:DegV family protein with EDD domain